MGEWERIQLGDVIDIKHGYAFKGENFLDRGERIVLTPGNFRRGGGLVIRPEKERYYAADFPDEFLLRRGDLLVAMTDLTQGAPLLGSPLFIPSDDRYLHNQRLGKVILKDESRIAREFAFFLFCNEPVRAAIRASATGSTVKHTAPGRIASVETRLPGLREQKRIASVLAAYDDLIENNTKRIRVLEEMARTLWADWKGSVGLCIGLGELVRLIRDQVDPTSIDPATPYVGLEHIPRRSFDMGEHGDSGEVTSAKTAFVQWDILFGKIRPYFHKVAPAAYDGITSNDAVVMRVRSEDDFAAALMCVSSDEFVASISQKANGSKMPRADWSDMASYGVPCGSPDDRKVLNLGVRPLVEMIQSLGRRNRVLRAARDLLLPKLLSGELSVDRIPDPAEVAT